jgi:hypothetical protein
VPSQVDLGKSRSARVNDTVENAPEILGNLDREPELQDYAVANVAALRASAAHASGDASTSLANHLVRMAAFHLSASNAPSDAYAEAFAELGDVKKQDAGFLAAESLWKRSLTAAPLLAMLALEWVAASNVRRGASDRAAAFSEGARGLRKSKP